MSRKTSPLLCVVILLAVTHTNAADDEPETREGIIFAIGGVGGCDSMPFSAKFSLPLAKVPHQVKRFHWSHGFGQILKDLQDTRHTQRKAKELAELVLAYKKKKPDRPIYLLAYSGGAGLAIYTAEMLPPETLERVVLCSAAMSPDYDLSAALRASRKGIVSFHSKLDRVILHWGTWQFGTMDRYYTASAGCEGFDVPDDLCAEDRRLYSRLVQVPWEPRMLLHGHNGGHVGVQSPVFLIQEVAPYFKE